MKNKADKINFLIKIFPFEKVRQCMKVLDWEYTDDGIPSIIRLKKAARSLLEDVENNSTLSSGGFHASIEGEDYSLEFMLAGENSEYYKDRSVMP